MKNNQILGALAMDLKRAALGYFSGSNTTAKRFYEEHKEKSFFKTLWQFTIESPVLLLILTHPTSVDVVGDFRKFIGSTDPNKAEIGTIRERYGNKEEYARGFPSNAIHGSDSHESAIREIRITFREFDLSKYEQVE